MATMGHSMGAWILPLAIAYEPLFGAVVLSGAGGSWSRMSYMNKSRSASNPTPSSFSAMPRMDIR
jgi:hypothetical protein